MCIREILVVTYSLELLWMQGKWHFFSTKLEMAHQTYIGGAHWWVMTGHGWGANTVVGLTRRTQAKSRWEGICRQKSLAPARIIKVIPIEIFVHDSDSASRAHAKSRREGHDLPVLWPNHVGSGLVGQNLSCVHALIIKVIPIEIFVYEWDSTFPCPCQATARRHSWCFAIWEVNGGFVFLFLRLLKLKIFVIKSSLCKIAKISRWRSLWCPKHAWIFGEQNLAHGWMRIWKKKVILRVSVEKSK